MPNRIVRESMLDSDRYLALPHDSERLMFVELLLLADDFGLVPLNYGFLRRRCTPCASKTPEQVTAMVSALADQDLIRVYTSESGAQFGFIPRYGNAPRAKKPKWPMPPKSPAFNEINELAQKRIAEAQRTQTKAPETETETETETTPRTSRKRRAAKSAGAPSGLVSVSDLMAEGVEQQHAKDWLAIRKDKRLPLTQTAWDGVKAEAMKACLTPAQAVHRACIEGWAGFKASWLSEAPPPRAARAQPQAEPDWRREARERAQALGGSAAIKTPARHDYIDVEATDVTPASLG